MSRKFALTGAPIFDGESMHDHHGLLVSEGLIAGILDPDDLPDDCDLIDVKSGILAPGFNDLQVNGGGGVLFNEQPTLQGIETICQTHIRYGTTGLLPTLITDTPQVTKAAIDAGILAQEKAVPGFLGLHLEGPHLSREKKGAHDPSLIRPMGDEDCQQLVDAKAQLANLLITVAPESVSDNQISRLSEAGIVVSLGHSAASLKRVTQARQAGASCITHLYNAMSPLTHREPGMVGAGLAPLGFHCGLIADGYHVDPSVIEISLAAKHDSANIFLVSDAMSTIGTDQKSFTLNGRTIYRDEGRLVLEDGTLAGADLELNTAVRYLVEKVGVDVKEALRMASIYPMNCLNNPKMPGGFVTGQKANIIHLNDELEVRATWVDGQLAFNQDQ